MGRRYWIGIPWYQKDVIEKKTVTPSFTGKAYNKESVGESHLSRWELKSLFYGGESSEKSRPFDAEYEGYHAQKPSVDFDGAKSIRDNFLINL